MNEPPPYAPTTHSSYTPSGHTNTRTNIGFHEEITKASIVKTPIQRAVYDSLCEIYSILTVAEMVENALVKDFITDKEKYTSTMIRLINQFIILRDSLSKSPAHQQVLQQILPGIASDCSNLLHLIQAKFNLVTPLASERLQSGIPATIKHFHGRLDSSDVDPRNQSDPRTDSRNQSDLWNQTDSSRTSTPIGGDGTNSATGGQINSRLAAQSTGHFITVMDAVKLDYKTKQQLHPLLSNLVISLNDTTTNGKRGTSFEFPGKSRLVTWLIKLNNLDETQQLTPEECEEFLHDLDSAYKGFFDLLE